MGCGSSTAGDGVMISFLLGFYQDGDGGEYHLTRGRGTIIELEA